MNLEIKNLDDVIYDMVIVGAALFAEILVKEGQPQRNKPSVRVNPYLMERKSKGRFAVDVCFLCSNLK